MMSLIQGIDKADDNLREVSARMNSFTEFIEKGPEWTEGFSRGGLAQHARQRYLSKTTLHAARPLIDKVQSALIVGTNS
jgi:trehalose-6-phosphate synthase